MFILSGKYERFTFVHPVSVISGHQSINPWREEMFILSGKYERFTFVRPVSVNMI